MQESKFCMSQPKETREAWKTLLQSEMVTESLPDKMCWLTGWLSDAVNEVSLN